jgi:hypothetical protein
MELAYSGSTQAYRPFTNFGGIGSQTDGANSIYRCGMAWRRHAPTTAAAPAATTRSGADLIGSNAGDSGVHHDRFV